METKDIEQVLLFSLYYYLRGKVVQFQEQFYSVKECRADLQE